MTFLDRCLIRCRKEKNSLPLLEKWIAENQSLHPATITYPSWLPHYRTAREALYILFLSLFLPEWESWEIISRIKESCYFQRYDGGWKQVQEILEQVSSLQSFEEKFLGQLCSEDDFFGNFLPQANKFLRKNTSSFKPTVRDLHRPKRKVYRRGYRDKGSLRPYHQRGRNLPDPTPGEDRRGKVIFAHLPDL